MAGSRNLNDVPIVDAHMHPLRASLISEKYEEQSEEFSAALLPLGNYDGKEKLRQRLLEEYREHVMAITRRTGYFNYVSRTYGVSATVSGFDHVLGQHTKSDEAFSAYIRSVLDREKIDKVVLESREPIPARPDSLIPPDRFVWTYYVSDLAGIEWARERRLDGLAQVLRAIDETLEQAVANGCRGFKNESAYYDRPLHLEFVTREAAETAFSTVMAAQPSGYTSMGKPYYDGVDVNEALRTYQDYLYRYIYIKAGLLKRPIIVHTAVVLHPVLTSENNDPRGLYDIFTDPDVVKAGTVFVLIHTGWPWHHEVASLVSQFPRVYVDVSHISKYPTALEESYRALLSFGPASRVMHGSDAGSIPEEVGYCAWNTRFALARVLSDYRRYYGWTQADIDAMAEQVLHGNAREVFGLNT